MNDLESEIKALKKDKSHHPTKQDQFDAYIYNLESRVKKLEKFMEQLENIES